jgi:hypothetical protein
MIFTSNGSYGGTGYNNWVDSGDAVILKDDLGNSVDFVRYGDSTKHPPGNLLWSGENPPVLSSRTEYLRRSIEDWTENPNSDTLPDDPIDPVTTDTGDGADWKLKSVGGLSEYMVGSVFIQVIFMSEYSYSDTDPFILEIKDKVAKGFDYWMNQGESVVLPGHTTPREVHLDYHIDVHSESGESYSKIVMEPLGTQQAVGFEAVEIEYNLKKALGGFGGSEVDMEFDEVIQEKVLTPKMRDYDTLWGCVVFVADSREAQKRAFIDGEIARSALGGPWILTCYDCGGYGHDNLDLVCAHEFGHIFYALDEYLESDVPPYGPYAHSGYLNAINGNFETGGSFTGNPCIMKRVELKEGIVYDAKPIIHTPGTIPPWDDTKWWYHGSNRIDGTVDIQEKIPYGAMLWYGGDENSDMPYKINDDDFPDPFFTNSPVLFQAGVNSSRSDYYDDNCPGLYWKVDVTTDWTTGVQAGMTYRFGAWMQADIDEWLPGNPEPGFWLQSESFDEYDNSLGYTRSVFVNYSNSPGTTWQFFSMPFTVDNDATSVRLYPAIMSGGEVRVYFDFRLVITLFDPLNLQNPPICDSTKRMIGWQDDNPDDILDVQNTHPMTTLHEYYQDTTDTTPKFQGVAMDIAANNLNPFGPGKDVTINTISQAGYKMDYDTSYSYTVNATDGYFDSWREEIEFTTHPLRRSTGPSSPDFLYVQSTTAIRFDPSKSILEDSPSSNPIVISSRNTNSLIADSDNHRVIEVDGNNRVIWEYGTYGVSGSDPNELNTPTSAVRLNDSNTLIADYYNNRVIIIKTSDYNPELENNGFTSQSIIWSKNNNLNIPSHAEQTPNGDILIADTGNNRVVIASYSNPLNELWVYTTGLSYPECATTLSNGNILITDSNNDRVIEVSYSYQIIEWVCDNLNYPCYAVETPIGNILISETNDHFVFEVTHDSNKDIVWSYGTSGSSGSGVNYLHNPTSALRLVNGNTLITDRRNDRVIEIISNDYPSYDENSIFWSYSDLLSLPNTGVEIDRNTYTLITDHDNNKIIEVDRYGHVKWRYGGTSGSGVNQLNNPHDAIRLSDGNTLITDTGNNRVILIRTDDYNATPPDYGYTEDSVLWSYGCGTAGHNYNELFNPFTAVQLSNNNILIADKYNHRVIEVDYNTRDIVWQYGTSGAYGSGFDQLHEPCYVTCPSSGKVLITDTGNQRVIEVDYNTKQIVWQYGTTGVMGDEINELSNPYKAERYLKGGLEITIITDVNGIIEVYNQDYPNFTIQSLLFRLNTHYYISTYILNIGNYLYVKSIAGDYYVEEYDESMNFVWHYYNGSALVNAREVNP